jgi:uncharacterized membrane protein AbrB (regulator of aidB expression)
MTRIPGDRALSGYELMEVFIVFAGAALVTALGTWIAGFVGVPVGWRLAAGACAAVLVVASARLGWYRQPVTARWLGMVVLLWVAIMITNALADVRFW